MSMRVRHHILSSSSAIAMMAACLGLAAPQSALAEAAAGAEAGAAVQETALQEIVVTAQKREQRLSDVGMSITAQTGSQLKAQGVKSIEDFVKIDTSFSAGQTFTGTPSYTIRGIGYYSYALAAPPAVSVYIDEVPLAYSPLTRGADMDLDRVEILKGPQGTLFGQNSTGGAINFIAAKPTANFEAGIEGTLARFGALNLNGYVSGPVSDSLQMRLAVDTDQGGAWQRSYTRKDSLGDKRFVRGRFLADWTPTADLRVRFSLSGWQDRSDTQAGQLNGIPFLSQISGEVPKFLNYPAAPHNDRAADWDPSKPLKADDDFYLGSVRIEYDLSHDVTLTSISAYSGYHAGSAYGFDGVNFENFYQKSHGTNHSASQEVRLSGKAFESRLDWVAGANYAKDLTHDGVVTFLTEGTPTFSFAAFGAPRWDSIDNRTRSDVATYAAFTNLDYKLTDTLSIVAGARYTDTQTKFSGCSYDPGNGLWATGINDLQFFFKNVLHSSPAPFLAVQPGGCTTFDATLTPAVFRSKLRENNTSWHTELDWKPTPASLLYVSTTKGYKAGAFPIATNLEAKSFSPVTQEAVQAYEAGFKTFWFERTLQIDGAYFHYDYTNKQIQGTRPSIVFGTLFGLINVPESKVDGVELSGQWRAPAIDGLTLHGAMSYLDSEVTSNFINVDRLNGTENLKGEAFPNTPKWSYSLGLSYERTLRDDLRAYFAADYSHRSATHSGLGNLDIEKIGAYGLLDLRAGVKSADGKYSAELFGRNVTNQYYWLDADYLNDAGYRRTGMPATFGIRLGYRFQ